MSDEEDLSSILSGDEPEETTETNDSEKGETAESDEDEETASPAAEKTDETDKPAAKSDDNSATKAGDAKDTKSDDKPAGTQERSPVSAIIAMRHRLQAAENRVRELEGGGGKGAAKPSVLDDEDGAFNARIDEGTRGLREQNYHLSVKLARMSHGDSYAEAEEAFAAAAEKDDRLIASLRTAPDPGEYIYTLGLQIKELSDVNGDFVAYRKKITAASDAKLAEKDVRIAALEKQVADLTRQKSDLDSIPKNLNTKSSGATPKSGDEDDEDIGKIVRFGSSTN